MKYRLGLDVGTASVGLVALELDKKGRPVEAIYESVRIFAEPLQPAKKGGGVGEPKKAVRRLARQQRRRHERRARQMKRIAQLAQPMGLDPEKISADEGQRIHEKRALAATSRVSLEDLLRIFLKMAKRRGYYGGFKVKKDNDKGAVETGISKLKAEMEKHQCETLGQYLWHRNENNKHLRLKEEGLFTDRQMLQDEFERIWTEQEKHHPVLKEKHRERSLRECFERAIVEQRPLKSPAPMIGNCSLEPMLPRAPMAQPAMQAFRIEKQIADLRWGSKSPLSPEQREVIRKELQSKKEVKFTALYRALQKAGCPGPEGRELNLAHGDRGELTGDKTAGTMKTLKLQDKWEKMMARHQVSVINLLADMGSPEVFDAPEWDKNLMGSKGKERKIEPEVKEFIEAMIDTEKFGRLAKMGFDGGRASYSIKALGKLVEVMQKDGVDEHDAIDKTYPESQNQAEQLNATLPSHDLTGNTVIDVALTQVGWEVNKAIDKLGAPPAQIIIELSRDMKAGLKTREEMTAKMRDNEKRNKIAAKEINKHTGSSATLSQIKRYLLWEEQGKKYCPYCSEPINLSAAINGNQTEYEHILPKSLTRIGKKRDFLVLAHKSCNQAKKDQTPWQTWGQDKERWKIIEERAKKFEAGYEATINGKERKFKHKGKARQLLIKDFETEALDEELIGEFSERQFQESAWIAKAYGKWLRRICADVSVSRGLLTAHLRRTWGLDTVIPEVRYEEKMPVFDEDYQASKKETEQEGYKIPKADFDKYRSYWEGQHVGKDKRTTRRLNKRIDHRHHLVDALVIALTTRGLYQRMARHYQQETDAGERKPRLHTEPELRDIRIEALRLVRDCSPSHKPDRRLGGNMFLDTAKAIKEENGKQFYVSRKNLSTIKKGDIEKIVSETTRKEIEKVIKRRLEQGMTLEEALKEPINNPQWDTPIRRVLLRGYEARDAVKVEHGDRQSDLYKHLEPEGYAYLEFDSKQADSVPTLVRLHEAIKQGNKASEKTIVRFYKNDTVRDDKDGKCYIIKQFKEEGPAVFLCPITEAVADIGKVNAPRRKKISGKQIKRLTLAQDDCSSGSTG